MANNSVRNWDDEIARLNSERKKLEKHKAHGCDHNTKDPVVPLASFNGYQIPNRKWYTDSTMIHPECGTMFDAKAWTPEEVHMIFFNALSVFHQIKYVIGANTSMTQDKLEELNNLLAAQENIRDTIEPFYNEMVKNMSKADNDKNRNKNNRKIGRIGISAAAYNS